MSDPDNKPTASILERLLILLPTFCAGVLLMAGGDHLQKGETLWACVDIFLCISSLITAWCWIK